MPQQTPCLLANGVRHAGHRLAAAEVLKEVLGLKDGADPFVWSGHASSWPPGRFGASGDAAQGHRRDASFNAETRRAERKAFRRRLRSTPKWAYGQAGAVVGQVSAVYGPRRSRTVYMPPAHISHAPRKRQHEFQR